MFVLYDQFKKPRAIRYEELSVVALECIKEQKKKIAALEQKVILGDNAPPDDLETIQHELSPDGDEVSGAVHELDHGNGNALETAVRARRLLPRAPVVPKAKKLSIASIPMSI